MGLYLDTSCLLKLFFQEPESASVAARVAAENRVVVSTLARLELRVQIQGRMVGGTLSGRLASTLMAMVDRTLIQSPFEIAEMPGNVYAIAARQIVAAARLSIAEPSTACTWRPWRRWGCVACSPPMRPKRALQPRVVSRCSGRATRGYGRAAMCTSLMASRSAIPAP